MGEPVYLAQTAEPMDADGRRAWIRRGVEDAKARGVTFLRATVDDADNPTMTLLEGWESEPEDQGEPRWQMVEGDGGSAI